MVQAALIKSLKINFLCGFLCLNICSCFSQKSIRFYAGAGINETFCNKIAITGLRNSGTGIPSPTADLGAKLKFNKHFSLILQYAWIRNHIIDEYKDLKITYFNHYSQAGGTIGDVTFVDNIYLNGNIGGINFNYEKLLKQSNLVFSIGFNRAFYNTKLSYIKRHYESLPSTSNLSKLEPIQTSNLSGPNFTSINVAISYEKMCSERLGFFAKLNFFYNFINTSYEYNYSNMGLTDNYIYSNGNQSTSVLRYYSISFHTLNFTMGIFCNLNIRPNEKHSNN